MVADDAVFTSSWTCHTPQGDVKGDHGSWGTWLRLLDPGVIGAEDMSLVNTPPDADRCEVTWSVQPHRFETPVTDTWCVKADDATHAACPR